MLNVVWIIARLHIQPLTQLSCVWCPGAWIHTLLYSPTPSCMIFECVWKQKCDFLVTFCGMKKLETVIIHLAQMQQSLYRKSTEVKLTPRAVEGSSSWPSPAGSGTTYLWPTPSPPPEPSAPWKDNQTRGEINSRDAVGKIQNLSCLYKRSIKFNDVKANRTCFLPE